MSKIMEIRLTPLEPYFFGSDRTFYYGEKDIKRVGRRTYYVRSEKMPMQTTLFGILRYLGIQNVKEDYDIRESEENIGSASFRYGEPDQKFGRIISISPLYLTCGNGHRYMPVPMDHKKGKSCYTPFTEYKEVNTTVGRLLVPVEYDAKEGISNGLIDTGTGEVIPADDVFGSVEKTGIDINRKTDAYYKMEYCRMEPEFSFAFRAAVEDGFPEIGKRIVYMGGKKSAFLASVTETSDPSPEEDMKDLLKDHPGKVIYVASDSFLRDEGSMAGIEAAEKSALFSIVDFKTAREYVTNYGKKNQKDRFTKSEKLYRLVRAGSIFISDSSGINRIASLFEDAHFNTIGMNHCIIGGSEK